jgi:DinB family protein
MIRAGWRALDAARNRATGKVLRKGPRGGGRELGAIVRHVVDADVGHLAAVGWKLRSAATMADRVDETRSAIIEALSASARGQIPPTGPRGGSRWPVRFFVRRVVWHSIAHAWEIERRIH